MTGVLAMWLMMCVPMFFLPGCGCCFEPIPCSTCTDSPKELAQEYSVTVSGVSAGTCSSSECNGWNGTFIIGNVPAYAGTCNLESAAFTAAGRFLCTSNDVFYEIYWGTEPDYSSGLFSRFVARDFLTGTPQRTVASYKINGDHNCHGSTVYDLEGNLNRCTWPSSVTVVAL